MEYWSSDKTSVNKPREPKFLQGLNDAEKAEKNWNLRNFWWKKIAETPPGTLQNISRSNNYVS